MPAPGQLVISPALEQLLASPTGTGLRPRLSGVVVGTIGGAGLVDPGDLRFYAGMIRSGGQLPSVEVASGWGVPKVLDGTDDLTTRVLIAGTTILIVPLLLLVGLSLDPWMR